MIHSAPPSDGLIRSKGSPLAGFARTVRALLFGGLITITLASASSLLSAQAPSNDAFPGTLLPASSTNIITGSNVDATSEAGEPAHAGNPAGASVWWTWVAPESGTVVVDTLESTFDTVLGVYAGETVDALTLIGANDDAAGLATSLVTFQATQGTAYRVAVDGYQGATGSYQLRIRLPVAPAPPAIVSQPASQTVPEDSGSNVTFSVSVTGSFPRFFEWQKNGARLETATNSSFTITNAVLADAGDYRVIVTNNFGSITSSVAVLSVRAGLDQESFAGRVPINGTSATVTAHNYGADSEPGEPNHAGVDSGASVWWSWTAPQSGLVELDTAGSTNYLGGALDTVLAVYVGTDLSTLSPRASNDDEMPGLIKTSKVTFRALAGVTYQIAVAGVLDADLNPARGDIVLNLTQFPNNDYYASALEFPTGATTVFDDNTDATIEAGEPSHAGNPGGKSVWWYWVAPASGAYELDTVGSSIDTLLAVYTGTSVGDLKLVSEDDNRSDDGASIVKFFATSGAKYHFAVDGFSTGASAAGGQIVLNLNPSDESNDDFADRITLTGQTNQVTGSTIGASKEAGEPAHGGNAGGRSIWWTWTAHLSAPVIITTRNSSFDTTLAVYIGTQLSSLTLVKENDDVDAILPGGGSLVTFIATAGQTYQIAVDGYRNDNGDVAEGSVSLSLVQVTPPAPGGNDMFANRFSLAGPTNTVVGVNTSATEEVGEPNHAGNDGGRSIWWSWVAPASAPVKIETLGSEFDTLLGVYQGSSVGALTLVASDQDSAGDGRSVVTFEAVEGVEYQIAVDGFNDGSGAASGKVLLNIRQYSGDTLQANDDFADASPIFSPFLTVTGLNIGATRESGEPAHGGNLQGHSIWWTWTATTDEPVTISTLGSQFDTILAVYTGNSLGALSLVAENDDVGPFDLQSRVTFQAVAGTTYRIAVDGYGNQFGNVILTVSPGSDVPAAPQIQQQPVAQTRFAGGAGGGADVSFKVIATGSLPLSFQWTRNGVPVPDATNEVITLNNAGANEAGTYQVTVTNLLGTITSSGAEFTWNGVPFNDDFSNRILLSGSDVSTKGSVLGASKQTGEPHHGGEIGGRSIWWRWIAPASGPAEVNTIGSPFDSLLAIYQGTDIGSLTLIGENNDLVDDHVATSRVVFNAIAGQEYEIAVDGVKTNAAAGSVLLRVRQPPVIDTTKPTISISAPSASLTKNGPVTYTVSYDDANFNKSTLGVGDIALNRTGTANGSVSVSGTGAARTVTISNISGDGSLGISIAAGTATDTVGNSADGIGSSATFGVDNTKPSVTISAPTIAQTETDPVAYIIEYIDPNFNGITLSESDIQLNRTGSANASVTVLNAVSTATVVLFDITGAGTLGISIGAGTASDRAGNLAGAAGPSTVVGVIDETAPLNPGKPDLLAANDTGRSNADDITSASVLTFEGTGESGTTLTLIQDSAVLGSMQVVGNKWSLSWTNPLPGTHTLTAYLTDAAGNASAESDPLSLVVDRTEPTISTIPDQVVNEDGVLNVAFVVGDSQAAAGDLIVQAISSNTSLIPNGNLISSGAGGSRSLQITPAPNLSGNANITLTVIDVAGNAATLSFQVAVLPVNDIPTLDAIPNQTVLEASGSHVLALTGISAGTGETQNLSIRATSDNTSIIGHPVTVLASPPTTATLTFAPVGHANGKVTISVIVTDDGGGLDSVTNKFDILVQPVNFTPFVQSPLVNQSGVYGSFLSLAVPANAFSDPDPDDSLSYSTIGTLPGISFDPSSRTFSGIPNAAGVFVISVVATDRGGLSATSSFQLAIGKAPLAVAAENKGMVYGAPLPQFTATYTGFVAGDTPASLLSPAVFSTTATSSSGVGNYSINAGGATSPNYDISFSPGTLTVSRAALRIAATDVTLVYGDAFPAFTAVITGLVAGDTSASLDIPVTLTADATSASNAGTYPIKVTGGDDANYTVERVSGSLTIIPAPLVVKAKSVSRSYLTGNPPLSGTVTGLKNGESITISYTTGATFDSPVGDYPIVPAISDPDGVLAHYTLDVVPGSLTVLDKLDANGVVFDGYIAGGTVFFDANDNRKRDSVEPFATTGEDGHFSLSLTVGNFDKNHDNRLDASDGVIVLVGGVDILTGVAFKGVLSAPAGATVVTPLTTLVTEALVNNPLLTPDDAQIQIKAALGLPSTVDLTHYDPFAASTTNDASALKVISAGAKVQDTVALISALFASSSTLDEVGLFRLVTDALLNQIQSGNSDLSRPDVVQGIISASQPANSLPDASFLLAAANAIASNNAAKDSAATNASPSAGALEIGRLQGVAQRELTAAFKEATVPGTISADALLILNQAEEDIDSRTSPVGVNSATDKRPGSFGFDTQIYQVNPAGKGSAKVTVIRTDGSYGAVTIGLKINGATNLSSMPLAFGSREISHTVDLLPIIYGDREFDGARSVSVSLEEIAQTGTNTPALGPVTTAVVTVRTDPTVTEPADAASTLGGQAVFSATVTGFPKPSVQWSKNGVDLIGETNSVLALTNLQASDEGLYRVTASNTVGVATSRNASLSLKLPPVISGGRTNVTLLSGESTVLQFSVAGSSPIQYQWRKNGADITGQTNLVLNLADVQATDAGGYTLFASNSFGSTTSPITTLTVEELSFQFLSIKRQPDGKIELTMNLSPGHRYLLQQSTDLKSWSNGSEISPQQTPYTLVLDALPLSQLFFRITFVQ